MCTVFALSALVCVFSLPPHATLIDFGNVTRDTDSGLDWLDVPITANLSYRGVLDGVGNTWLADGWRYATGSEVCALFHSAMPTYQPPKACPHQEGSNDGVDYTEALAVTNLLGSMIESQVSSLTSGMYVDARDAHVVTDTSSGERATASVSDFTHSHSVRDPNVGHWLVRAVPEPIFVAT